MDGRSLTSTWNLQLWTVTGEQSPRRRSAAGRRERRPQDLFLLNEEKRQSAGEVGSAAASVSASVTVAPSSISDS